MTFPFWAWLTFAGLVAVLLFLDLFVFHRGAREVPFGEAMWLSGFWIAISLAFGGFVWFIAGPQIAGEYLAAYLIEKSLSLDNVFVFAVIFSAFAVPRKYRYHVLFWGVIGALVARAVFILAGTSLLSAFDWLVLVFGAFLLFTALRMFRGRDEDADPQSSRVLKLMRRILPTTKHYRGDHFFVRENGKLYATPLLAALVVVETSDIMFAIDSVPAVLAVTSSAFIAYSSNAFAVLGLRALYFALEGLIDRFVYLHYGLAAILTFVGAKLLLQGFGVHVPIVVSLLVILVAMMVSIGVSLIATRGSESSREDDEPDEASGGSDRGSHAPKSADDADALDSPLRQVVGSRS
jgi:tellurite resistance protein TerC